MTLDEMLQQCASDIDEELPKSNGVFVGKALVLANKILTGLNYAYQKIAREKHVLTAKEAVALGSGETFSESAISQPVVKLFNVYGSDKTPAFWVRRNQTDIWCPDLDAGETVEAEYSYLPPKLAIGNLNDSPLFPEARVDHLLLCYYANFYVLSLEPDNESREKASTFLSLFNNGVDEIKQNISEYLSFRVE